MSALSCPLSSSADTDVQVTELVTGSLASEVQRVTLRDEGAITSTGTFRLEVGDGMTDGGGRSRIDADHDGRYWTSALSATSSAEEVRTRLSKYMPVLVVAKPCTLH